MWSASPPLASIGSVRFNDDTASIGYGAVADICVYARTAESPWNVSNTETTVTPFTDSVGVGRSPSGASSSVLPSPKSRPRGFRLSKDATWVISRRYMGVGDVRSVPATDSATSEQRSRAVSDASMVKASAFTSRNARPATVSVSGSRLSCDPLSVANNSTIGRALRCGVSSADAAAIPRPDSPTRRTGRSGPASKHIVTTPLPHVNRWR